MNLRSRISACVLLATTVACGGSSGPAAPAPAPSPAGPQIPSGVSSLVASMYQALPAHIASALAENQAILPGNPQAATQINAKIAMLRRPTLAAEISDGRRYVEGGASSVDGRRIEMAALFAEEWMRGEAEASIRLLERALSLLERFTGTPFPATTIRVWYGFKVGSSGGGGQVFMEDRTTYEGRTAATRMPHDAILIHELAHSYISNESLTQFLEMYGYNNLLIGSSDLASWTFTRGYVPFAPDNKDSAALLDVYRLIGHDAMSRAYKGVIPLRPAYGEPLSAAARGVFVSEAPAGVAEQVAAAIARITF